MSNPNPYTSESAIEYHDEMQLYIAEVIAEAIAYSRKRLDEGNQIGAEAALSYVADALLGIHWRSCVFEEVNAGPPASL